MTAELRQDLAALPAHRLAATIAAGDLSAAELTADCLARIHATDAKLHAFVALYEEEAMAVAEARDREARAGMTLGPLHGVPVALKCEMAGRVTTCGTLMWRDRVSPVTATVARRLQAAGMVVLGKTHMVEFAYGGWGTNAAMGTPWNPWDLDTQRAPGGSSSGTGVAVAAGLAPAGIGSDTGGSVRIPAAVCGTVGLKTTVGRISNHGILPLSDTLDTIGPLTRSVRDAALMFEALAGPDPADPLTLGRPPVDALAGIEAGVAGLRLGVLGAAELEGVDGEVMAAFEAACRTLERQGARIEEVRLPDSFPAYLAQTGLIIAAEAYAVHKDWIEDDATAFDENVRARILVGKSLAAADYVVALKRRLAVRREIAAVLEDFAALLTPTTPIPAPPLTEIDEGATPLSRFTRAVNYLDMCGLALPCGFTGGGLPISLQIIGHGYDEARVLRIGRAFEAATDWHERRPDLSALFDA
jgi:aspartyl-tRNA(Asn)/glutamyl-tRNA(Gln) amidotransferase subunit A